MLQWSLLVKNVFPHLPPLLFPPAPRSHLSPAALVYRSIFSHAILCAIFHTVCSSPRLLPLLLIPLIVCSSQVYPRKSTPAVDRLCVGVPAAEVSHNHTGAFSSSETLLISLTTFQKLENVWKYLQNIRARKWKNNLALISSVLKTFGVGLRLSCLPNSASKCHEREE